jgi:DeoR family fructose operon transcriptional repressor
MSGLLPDERHRRIVDEVARRGRLRLSELQSELGISSAALRRDVTELEARGLLVRLHGAVMHPAHLKESTLAQREQVSQREKRTIAQAAADLVQDRQTVLLDAGSTCLQIGRLLAARADLTLITNSLALAHAVQGAPATIFVIGGRLRAVSGAMVGGEALGALGHLNADWAFVGTSGLDAEGATTPELEEAALKQALLARSRRHAVVADAAKWGVRAAVRFADWAGLDVWITDAGLGAAVRRQVRAQGMELVIATGSP